jgi:hypothetical protein
MAQDRVMFAPYCPTCGHRVLLGWRRVLPPRGPDGELLDRDGATLRPADGLLLACHCGTVLDALAPSEVATSS